MANNNEYTTPIPKGATVGQAGTNEYTTPIPAGATVGNAAPTTPAARGEQALTKATAIKAQPPLFSKQWFKEKAFQGAFGTAEALPAAESMIGMELGGMGGTAFGLGYGGVPGAVAGGTFGGAAGEAQKQLILRALGFPSPTTPGQAASDIGTEGLKQGAFSWAAKQMTPALKAIGVDPADWLERWAESQYAQGLDPTTKINKAVTEKLVPQLLQQRIWGTLRGLGKQAESKAAELTPQLDTAYANWEWMLPQGLTKSGQVVGQIPSSGTQVVADLNKERARYIVDGVVHNPGAVDALDGILEIMKQHGPDISPSDLRRIRQIWDEPVAATGAFVLDRPTSYLINAEKAASNSAREILNSAPTDIGALDKRVSMWLKLQDVVKASALNDVGQKGGLIKAIGYPLAQVGSTLTGLHAGGVAGAAEYGGISALTMLAYEVSRTTVWRTLAAVQKARIADALARGSVDDMVTAIGRTTMAAIEGSKDWQARQKAMGVQAPSAGRNVTVSGPIPNSNSGGSTSAPPPTTPRAP